MKFIIYVPIVGLLSLSVLPALAFTIPANDGFVTDVSGVLSPAEERQIEDILKSYQVETSNEIAVLLVNSMEGDNIADSAFEIGRKWGVGTKAFNNGILLVIAIKDRDLFLATGYGLEGAVPDIVAKGIIDEEITPYFKNEKYADGILSGIDSLKKHIGGEYTADRYAGNSDDDVAVWTWIVFIIFALFQWFVAILGRTKSWWLGGVVGAFVGVVLLFIFSWWWTVPVSALIGLILDFIVSRNYKKNKGKASWWAGGGKWGGGSGGFGGFGGGSFGGGGAGGSW